MFTSNFLTAKCQGIEKENTELQFSYENKNKFIFILFILVLSSLYFDS